MRTSQLPVEQFAALTGLHGIAHGFTLRVPGVEMTNDKAEALARLDSVHREIRSGYGVGNVPFITAQQVHGSHVAVVDRPVTEDKCFDECDGLVTNQRGICLGIYVADCCAVYLVDPVHSAIGLVHSGKKGTELNVVGSAIESMMNQFSSRGSDLVVQLSPCIRPPHYELNFAGTIVQQCRDLGVTKLYDCGVCTACDLDRYYSYRAEKGRTGRMLAFLAMQERE